MNAYQAQRIRFGILAARHTLARGTMTPDQVEYLEGCEAVGWRLGDAGTMKAFTRERYRLMVPPQDKFFNWSGKVDHA